MLFCSEIGTLVHYQWGCKMVQLLWETVYQFLKKLKTEWPYYPAILHLCIYSKELKVVSRDICTPIFMVALFITSKSWNNPSVHEQMNE
jgi:hypothetical protein